jgi:hypothetical protein
MMVANAAGNGGGFGANSDAEGPTAGYDLPFKGMIMRRWREAADKNERKSKKNK